MAWSRLFSSCSKFPSGSVSLPGSVFKSLRQRQVTITKHCLSSSEAQTVKSCGQRWTAPSETWQSLTKNSWRSYFNSGLIPLQISNQVVLHNGPVLILRRSFVTTSTNCARSGGPNIDKSNTTALIYIIAVFVLMIGGSYAAVPLYKVFCQVSGLGGQAQRGHDTTKIEHMQKVERQIKVRFNADVASSMRWNFRPQQTEVLVAPGETALAFYTAKNPTDKPIIGISTYNVLPYDAGQYFNKIQCFCFEEQRLNPNEQVDMPVFFFIDPDFAEDPKLENVNTITLSYTFFEAKEGLSLPLPGYPQPHDAKILAS